MRHPKRTSCWLLALVLATGVVAFAGHSALHAGNGVEQCLVCASHFDPQKPVQVQAGFVNSGLQQGSLDLNPDHSARPAGFLHAIYARGPPSTA
jgi:hypothetical protein